MSVMKLKNCKVSVSSRLLTGKLMMLAGPIFSPNALANFIPERLAHSERLI